MYEPRSDYRCYYSTSLLGSCSQSVWRDGECRYHWHSGHDGFDHDTYYHRKIMAGLIDPTWGYFTRHELSAMFNRRKHGDGRRLDLYQSRSGTSMAIERYGHILDRLAESGEGTI